MSLDVEHGEESQCTFASISRVTISVISPLWFSTKLNVNLESHRKLVLTTRTRKWLRVDRLQPFIASMMWAMSSQRLKTARSIWVGTARRKKSSWGRRSSAIESFSKTKTGSKRPSRRRRKKKMQWAVISTLLRVRKCPTWDISMSWMSLSSVVLTKQCAPALKQTFTNDVWLTTWTSKKSDKSKPCRWLNRKIEWIESSAPR